MLAAQSGRRHPGLMLLQHPDDLFFRKPAPLHRPSPLSRKQTLTSNRRQCRGHGQPRLRPLCPGNEPYFRDHDFKTSLSGKDLTAPDPDKLPDALLPLLIEAIDVPGAESLSDFDGIFNTIVRLAVTDFWREVADYQIPSNQLLLQYLRKVDQTLTESQRGQDELRESLEKLVSFARSIDQGLYNKLADRAPPKLHTIDDRSYSNPFIEARAEDFNHNYEKLARLFQGSPEWESIQSRTDNVFIEGGRGTGKSMLLRRLTAQATIAEKRIHAPHAAYKDVKADYFGVYMKLTRGYYEQFDSETVPERAAALLAQHELNIEIFMAFVYTLDWMMKKNSLPELNSRQDSIIQKLNGLFQNAETYHSLEQLYTSLAYSEQDQIHDYYKKSAFLKDQPYEGSAVATVVFLSRLSSVFRDQLFPERQIRLFLLVDEFEALSEIQQVALNTVIKMRLPDLTLKIAVRKLGRKTSATFTQDDPIQEPRDYTLVRMDYDASQSSYKELLNGIASKRLEAAGYPNTDIRTYLPNQPQNEEATPNELEAELQRMWKDGNRRKDQIGDEFRNSNKLAAVYRVLGSRRKSFTGFDQYALLSSGVISNFIEICKYAFYFALDRERDLFEESTIPFHMQTDAVYFVSQRLVSTIESNVEVVGAELARLLTDLGEILRERLLHHPSEPEANRIDIERYQSLQSGQSDKLKEIIEGAIRWSVFHVQPLGSAFLPKNSAAPLGTELVINRIYCPTLRISPRARWRIRLSVEDLRQLVQPDTHDVTYQRLMRNQKKEESNEPTLPFGKNTITEGNQETER